MSDGLINPTYSDSGPEWALAGWTGFDGNYHEYHEGDNLNYADMDLATISWTDAEDGSTQYARLVGPWDDYNDLEDVVETYFEQGTP